MRNLIEFLKKYNYWFVFLLLEGVSLVLMFQFNSYQGSVWFTSANYLSGMIHEADSKVGAFFHQGGNNQELTERNLFLEKEVEMLRQQLIDERLKHDSTSVDSVNQPVLAPFKLISAKVIGNSLDRLDNFITLDKGFYDGVRADMAVASGNGVVGVVYMASGHYSVVIPVLSSKSNISCAIQGKGYFGYLHWRGGPSDVAYVDDIPRHAKFEKGDTIVTSGYSSMFPAGILVGHVLDFMDSKDGQSFTLKVKLSTNFGTLRDVCVIDDKAVRESLQLLRQANDSIKPKRTQ